MENVAIVIPTKIIDSNLVSLLGHLLRRTSAEIVVVKTDECSVEGFSRFHREAQVRLVTARASRGGQIRQGIVNSESSLIWVLHADSVIDDSTIKAITEMARRQDEVWGRFNLSLIPSTRMLQLISFLIILGLARRRYVRATRGCSFIVLLFAPLAAFQINPLWKM